MLTDEFGHIFASKAMKYSQAPISGKHIGVYLLSALTKSNTRTIGSFLGCNIELATSMVFHAERVALVKSLSEGYKYPLELHLIADNKESCAALCGYCRQDFMYLNPHMRILVYHPNGDPKSDNILIDLMNSPYLGKSKIGQEG